jgi:hypothetical protein
MNCQASGPQMPGIVSFVFCSFRILELFSERDRLCVCACRRSHHGRLSLVCGNEEKKGPDGSCGDGWD